MTSHEPTEPRRLAPDVIASWDPWIEPDPVEELRHVHVEGGSMGQAAREGLVKARLWWKWLDVQSVAGIIHTGNGWRVTVRVVDDQNPLRRRRWRMDWY